MPSLTPMSKMASAARLPPPRSSGSTLGYDAESSTQLTVTTRVPSSPFGSEMREVVRVTKSRPST